jgi:hypothetical protein
MDVDGDRPPVEGPSGDVAAPPRGWRARARRTPGGALLLKCGVFVLGLLFILLGLALLALPGPLTIPPILLGVWIWSSEFAWANRLFDRAKRSAREAWENARRRPVVSALVTGSGLVALGVGLYLLARYDLLARGADVIGL